MGNLTIAIDDDVLKRARMRALDQGTSVNALLREYLQTYAGRESVRTAGARLRALSERAHGSSGSGGRTWTRDELHER